MKKTLSALLVLSLTTIGLISIIDSEGNVEAAKSHKKNSYIQKNKSKETHSIEKEFIGRGDILKEQARQLQSLRYSSLEATGVYAEKNDVLTVNVDGQEGLTITVGSPELDDVQKKYSLKQGINTIKAETNGAIYITNPNDDGSTNISLSGATGSMPYFELNKTSVEDFKKQMNEATDARAVQLVSKKAIITVSYEAAKKYLDDPKVLMEYYDKFLTAEDRVAGLSNDGRPANYIDRHFQHYVEAYKLYMFTTNEYIGIDGDGALERLLTTNNGWGVWHESGHQRQQSSWKWNEVTETTVNIYSLAAQKEITGSVTALDEYYPAMHKYLNSEDKNYDAQGNYLKLVMFGQLANTFGDNFYPVLHQYYRENEIKYNNNNDRRQNFVINVSRITGYNMVPYFDEWGISIDDSTIKTIEAMNLLELDTDIWENDNVTNKKLPMRMIENVELTEDRVDVNLTDYQNDVLQGQELILKKNNEVISKLIDRKPENSTLNNNVWSSDVKRNNDDIITIEVKNSDGTYEIFKDSQAYENLMNKLLGYLNSEEEILDILTQEDINKLESEIHELKDQKLVENLLAVHQKVQAKYLEHLITAAKIDKNGTLVFDFYDSRFSDYQKITVNRSDGQIAEINKGIINGGNLDGNTVSISNQENQEEFSLRFYIDSDYFYYIVDISKLIIKSEINDLFLDNDHLKNSVTQEQIDKLSERVNKLKDSDEKAEFLTKLKRAQQLLLEKLISEMKIENKDLIVSFTDDLFKNYRVVILKDGKYLAEVDHGSPYYGYLNAREFKVTNSAVSGSTYTVQVRYTSGNYNIKELVAE